MIYNNLYLEKEIDVMNPQYFIPYRMFTDFKGYLIMACTPCDTGRSVPHLGEQVC